MIKVILTKEAREELAEMNNKLEKILRRINSIEDFQLDTCKMLNRIEQFQIDTYKMINKNDDDLKNWLLHEREINKDNYENILKGHKAKSDFAKMLDNFPYNQWLNDFEVSMVEKALNIELYPWQKEFLKGTNVVNINRASGKTFIFTLAYTLKLITLEMFVNYDNDVNICLLTPGYSNIENYVGEMFIDFWEKLSVYPFELNTTLKLTKEWSV